jgi:hypothetical protein
MDDMAMPKPAQSDHWTHPTCGDPELRDRTQNELVRMQFLNREAAVKFSEFQRASPFATMQEIFCGKGYAGLGIRLAA